MNWYGTIGVSVEGRVRDLRKLSRMARAYAEMMRQEGEPPDCVYEAEYFARQIENAVISLDHKDDSETAKIEFQEDCDTAHVPVFVMHAIADTFFFQKADLRIVLECEVVDSGSGEEASDRLTYSSKTGRWYDPGELFDTMRLIAGYTDLYWQDRLKQFRAVYDGMEG